MVAFAAIAGASAGVSLLNGILGKKSADRQKAREFKLRREQFEFAQDQYNDWNSSFGWIRDNLSNFYRNVAPEYYASEAIQDFETEYDSAIENLESSFSLRGINPDSNLAQSTFANAEILAAQNRAKIRYDSDRVLRQEQQGFLGLGIGQQAQFAQQRLAAGQNNINRHTDISNIRGAQAGAAIQDSFTSLGDILGRRYGGTINSSYPNPLVRSGR